MCHDLSFSASTVEFITDILPNIVIDGQIDFDFNSTLHVLSMSNRKCLTIINQESVPHLKKFEWGLIAPFMNTPELVKKYRTAMANCRAENILDKKSVWYRLRKNRCLIAVDGIYEHREIIGWKNKVPYFIKLNNSSHLLLPAIYNYSPNPNLETGELVGTFSVITREANTKMKQIHNHGANKHRMPLFYQPKDSLKWLDEGLTDDGIQKYIDYEIPSEELKENPVYTLRTTKERPDGKGKTELFHWPNLPPLGNDRPLNNELF